MQSRTFPPQGVQKMFRGLALVAGHPVLDFLNTIKYRGAAEPGDRLATFADVADWALIAGLISEGEAQDLTRSAPDESETARLCGEVRAFREFLRLLFCAPDRPDPAIRLAVEQVEQAISSLRPMARIDPASGVLTRAIPLDAPGDLKARIVAAAAELLSERPRLRIRTCGGEDCDWLFIDRTKAKRRRWCDSRTCGNIARVRRYRARQMAQMAL